MKKNKMLGLTLTIFTFVQSVAVAQGGVGGIKTSDRQYPDSNVITYSHTSNILLDTTVSHSMYFRVASDCLRIRDVEASHMTLTSLDKSFVQATHVSGNGQLITVYFEKTGGPENQLCDYTLELYDSKRRLVRSNNFKMALWIRDHTTIGVNIPLFP